MNTLRREDLNQELIKMTEIDSLGLFNNHYIIGYVSAAIPTPINKYEWINLSSKLENIKSLVSKKILTSKHVMQVVIVSLFKVRENSYSSYLITGLELKKFLMISDEVLNDIIIDPNCLENKYFPQITEKDFEASNDSLNEQISTKTNEGSPSSKIQRYKRTISTN